MKIKQLKDLLVLAELNGLTEIQFDHNYKYYDLSNDLVCDITDIKQFVRPNDNVYMLPLDRITCED